MSSAPDIFAGKVLIVDDQKVNILLLERMLRGAGYLAVSSTTSSCEACELHQLNRYDLILLDLQMPEMDGFSVMEGLRAISSAHPYKAAYSHAKAMDIITVGDGRTTPEHFDAVVLAAFVRDHQLFCDIYDTLAV